MSEAANNASPSKARATGYRLILPPGWVRIPLRHGTAKALEELLLSRLKDLPKEIPQEQKMSYRLSVRRAVEEQVVEAQKARGLDLYVSAAQRYLIAAGASFLVREVITSDSEGPEAVLASLAASKRDGAVSEATELDGTLAVRREYRSPSAPERGVEVPSRHVDYALAVPDAPLRYLAISFSTVGDGDPASEFSDALVELFDALMTTFRWTGGPDTSADPDEGADDEEPA